MSIKSDLFCGILESINVKKEQNRTLKRNDVFLETTHFFSFPHRSFYFCYMLDDTVDMTWKEVVLFLQSIGL